MPPAENRRRRVVLVLDPTTMDVAAVGDEAGALAARHDLALVVAMVLHRPWTHYLEPLAGTAAYLSDLELELDTMLALTRALEPYGVPWSLRSTAGDPIAAVTALAAGRDVREVLVGRASTWWGRRRAARVTRGITRRTGVPVRLILPGGGSSQEREGFSSRWWKTGRPHRP